MYMWPAVLEIFSHIYSQNMEAMRPRKGRLVCRVSERVGCFFFHQKLV